MTPIKKSHPSHLLSPREKRRFGATVGAAEKSEAEDVPRHVTAAEWAGGAAEGGPGSGETEAEGDLAFFTFVVLWSMVVGLGLCDLTV